MAVAAITAQRELVEIYFEKRFAERSFAFSEFFEMLQEGIEEKNDKQVDVALTGILGIARDSPLKDFESFTAAQLDGKVIEI